MFVYIPARGFIVTAIAMTMAGALSVSVPWRPMPPGTGPEGLLLGHFMMRRGEAFVTSTLTAIFVAFRPEGLASWPGRRYLRRA